MPFVVCTSKHPTAVNGAVSGYFFGNKERIVLLNRLNIISLYSESDQSLKHLVDFHLFASLRFVESIPLCDPRGPERHVVFLLSVKQEVSIVAFERLDSGKIDMITLYHGDVETHFHQGRVNDATWCCSGVYGTPSGSLLPVVLFSLYRGGCIAFDPVGAIAADSRASKGAGSALAKLFQEDYIQSVFKKAKRRPIFSHANFAASELDVRSVALVHRSGVDSAPFLLVLYADSSSKTHVSEYTTYFGKNDEQRHTEKATNRSWIPDAINLLPAADMIQRKGLLLTNVEPNACLLHAVPDGFFVIGPQLITFSSWKVSTTQPASSKNVTTVDVPHFGAYVEPVCCTALPSQELLILFEDGSCVKVTVKNDGDGLHSGKYTLVLSPAVRLQTIPKCVALVGDFCVVASHLANTLWARWRTGESGVLVSNCGPVFDITVALDGPRTGVFAGTGVDHNGGLSFVRAAVSVSRDVCISDFQDVRCVCVSHDIIIFSFPGYSRICRYCVGETTVLEELSSSTFDTSRETLLLTYSDEHEAFLQVTTAGVRIVKPEEGRYLFDCAGNGIEHAHANEGLIVFSNPAELNAFSVREAAHIANLHQVHETSCLWVLSGSSFLTGEWGTCAVNLYTLVDRAVQHKACFNCSATPCSMCVVARPEGNRLLVGLLNGYVVDVPVDEVGSSTSVTETVVTMQPVRLFNLESHNAVLCLGEVPLILIVTETRFQLTGVDLNDVALGAVIPNPNSPLRYILFSKTERALIFGNISNVQKLNIDFIGLKATVTRLKFMPWSGIFVVSIRRSDKDQLLAVTKQETLCPDSLLENPTSLELLENERCVFIESTVLGGSNEWSSCGDAGNKDSVVLIGTTFVFPHEQLSRSSRFTWCTVEAGGVAPERATLRLQGRTDVEGALQCCCSVPNYAGRIALGISGCVALFSWNPADSTFVPEETIRVGTIVTRIVPTVQGDTSYIVACDVRHSCFFIRVDTIQGSLSIAARDPELRGVMDGTVIQYPSHHDTCFADDCFNFFSVSHTTPSTDSSEPPPSTITTQRLRTTAQYHIGDLITAMQQGSFAPCSVINDFVPVPMALVPGVCGPQIAYGTSHGAFGTITPVTNETFLLLKSIEISVAAVLPPLGGFCHSSYREVLCAGQERGMSRNTSFEVLNPKAAEVMNRRRQKYLPKCVCSGDVVEMFLRMSDSEKRSTIKLASDQIVRWSPSSNTSLEEFVGNMDSSSLKNTAQVNKVSPHKSDDINELNAVLTEQSLPTLPLTVEAVSEFIRNIQRIQ